MSVFDGLVGQDHVVEALRSALDAPATMTHAWLFTGPPGSGRSVAARAFAAALQCPHRGCGACTACRSVLAGSHPDVEVVAPAELSYGVVETRELTARSALTPGVGGWRVVVVEDADRLTERAQNALLKAIEEPPPRTVWLLCAPSAEDLLPTVRSRCRVLSLRLPSAAAVAARLVAEGVDTAVASFAAHASQGHIGRARRLARDEAARTRRREVLALPGDLVSVPACFTAAANLVEAAGEDAAAITDPLDAAERAEHEAATTVLSGPRGIKRRGAGAPGELERRQRNRATRTRRDVLDTALTDLAAFYRDVLVRQFGAPVAAINVDLTDRAAEIARRTTPESTLRRIEAVLACREAIAANVAPLLAVEAMTLRLLAG